jgi:hypothetical protein
MIVYLLYLDVLDKMNVCCCQFLYIQRCMLWENSVIDCVIQKTKSMNLSKLERFIYAPLKTTDPHPRYQRCHLWGQASAPHAHPCIITT